MTVLPFDQSTLDTLLTDAEVDVVVSTTKHNVQYLLGGYRYFFFANMDAIGLSRYLPAVGYVREKPGEAFYIGCGNEAWGTEVQPPWVDDVRTISWSGIDTAKSIASALQDRGLTGATVAVEMGFIPADCLDTLRAELPGARFVDAQKLLESLRGIKSPDEVELVREASEKIIASMLATFGEVRPGMTRKAIVECFRRHQTDRGLVFDYCLIATGPSLNRAPSEEIWRPHSVLSLDSGGMFQGYIGDLARMAVHGEPTRLMVELMDQIESVQQAVRTVVRAGTRGGDLFATASDQLEHCDHITDMKFLAHGMGLITHEAPRLTSTGPVPYPGDHENEPLQAGNVLSIETWVEHSTVGFIKLEDTLIVTADGWEAPGDRGRGYTVIGA